MIGTYWLRYLLLASLAWGPLLSWGQADGYGYRRPLTGLRTTGYHRVVLPPDLLAALQPGMEDLRLFRLPAGDSLPLTEVPYLVRNLAPQETRTPCPLRQVRQSQNQAGTVVVLRREDDSQGDLMEVDLAARTYDVRGYLEGSDNRLSWAPVGESFRLIGLATDQMTYRYHRIAVPAHPYRFLRLQLEEPLEVTDVRLWAQTLGEGERQDFPLENWQVKNDTDEKVTLIDITLSARYPLDQLRLRIDTERDFFRPVRITYLKQTVETPEGDREIWRDWEQGILSSLESPVVSGPVVYAQRLQVRIQNFDDVPLDIPAVTVSGPVYDLVADLEATASYALYYGKPAAEAPRYDLVYFRDRLPERPVPVFLGAEEALVSPEAAEPTGGTGPDWLMWGIMGLVVVVVGGFTLRLLRKPNPEAHG